MARPRYPELDRQLLERERRRHGLTLGDLAKKVRDTARTLGDEFECVDESAMSRYERGESRPGPKRLRNIAQALGLTVDDLLAEKLAA